MLVCHRHCSVDYRGGRAERPPPQRHPTAHGQCDGSVSIHADYRAYKPLNWLRPPCRLVESEPVVVTHRRSETSPSPSRPTPVTSVHAMGPDPAWPRTGWRLHLQELLAAHPSSLGRRAQPWCGGSTRPTSGPGRPPLPRRRGRGRVVRSKVKRRGYIVRRGATGPLASSGLDRDSRLRRSGAPGRISSSGPGAGMAERRGIRLRGGSTTTSPGSGTVRPPPLLIVSHLSPWPHSAGRTGPGRPRVRGPWSV